MDKTLDFLEHTDGDRIRPDQIPYLFCGSTFMEAKSPSDPAQDPDGDTYPSPNLDKLGLPATIEEMYGTQVASSGDPYWISEMGSYVFERDPELARKFCDKKKNLGLTFDYTLPGGGNTKTQIMMLCNHVFTSTLYKEKLSAAGDITKGKTLRSNAPRSVTLLHEMFHVANGHNLLAGDGEECKSSSHILTLEKQGNANYTTPEKHRLARPYHRPQEGPRLGGAKEPRELCLFRSGHVLLQGRLAV